jgi:ketosteroid isomerase-like protein
MKKDMAAFADIWAPDAVQEIPFPPEIEGFESVWSGKEKLLAYYNKAMPGRRDHVFYIHDVHSTSDPNCVIVEASAHSVVIATGLSYDQRYIFIYRMRDGQIVLNREHVNPLLFMKTFVPPTQGAVEPKNGHEAIVKLDRGGEPADRIKPADEREATVLSFFTLLMKRDLDAFGKIWADDAVQEHPFGFEGLAPALTGREEILDDYRRMFRNRSDHIFTVYQVHKTLDPDCLIVEARGVSKVGETGDVYDNRYVALFRLRSGKIALNRFYFNPIVTQAAFKGVLIGNGISKQ